MIAFLCGVTFVFTFTWSWFYENFVYRILEYDMLTQGLKSSNRQEMDLISRYEKLSLNESFFGKGYEVYFQSIHGYNSGYLEFLYIHGFLGLIIGFVMYAVIISKVNISLIFVLSSIFLSNGYINWLSILLLTIVTSNYVRNEASMFGFK